MDYIKREDVLTILSEKNAACDALQKVKQLLSADVVEHKTGKWKMGKYDIFTVRCSECFETNGSFTNFCPNCGAEMTNVQNKT